MINYSMRQRKREDEGRPGGGRGADGFHFHLKNLISRGPDCVGTTTVNRLYLLHE